MRYALRVLRKNPGFTAVTVLVFALGIGANTAVFSVVYSVLFKALPYEDPGSLVVALHEGRNPLSPADFLDYRAQVRAFQSLEAAQAWGGAIIGPGKNEMVPGLKLTAGLIPMLGVEPLLGRTFTREEDQAGAPRVLVLSHGLWQRLFSGDPGVLGRSIRVSDLDYTVIGVMPPEFQFAPFWQTQAAMWTPLALGDRAGDRSGRSLRVFGRLRPGIEVAQAQAQMDTVARRLAAAYPETNTNLGVQLVPLLEKVVGPVRGTLLILFATAGIVLLIASANIANLVLTRAVGRRREIAIRLALGAGRGRVVRQLAVESMMLAAAGGLGGLLFASTAIDILNAILPAASLPRQPEIALHGAVLGFACLISVAAGLVSGAMPGLQASRVDLNEDLKSAGRRVAGAAGHRRTQGALVVAEVALALVLLTGAGLLIQSLRNLNAVDAGFDPDNLLTFQVFAPPARYGDGARRAVLFQQAADGLASLPGVRSVSAINHLPLAGDLWNFGYQAAGRPAPPPGQRPSAAYRVVRPGYFQTMGIPILQGRDFSDRDREETPAVVIVNQVLARRQWPAENPIGKQIVLSGAESAPLTVVGVAANARQSDWTAEVYDEVYLPYLQRADAFGLSYLTFVVRTNVQPDALSETVAGAIRAIDRDLPVSEVQSMERVVRDKLWRSRLSARLLALFAALSLVLAAVGIYGVISYAVRRRTAEIGVRLALGATRASLFRLILKEGMRPVAAGLVMGTALALPAARLSSSLLYGIRPADPATFLATAAILAVTALMATLIPAWRALRSDPMKALRQE